MKSMKKNTRKIKSFILSVVLCCSFCSVGTAAATQADTNNVPLLLFPSASMLDRQELFPEISMFKIKNNKETETVNHGKILLKILKTTDWTTCITPNSNHEKISEFKDVLYELGFVSDTQMETSVLNLYDIKMQAFCKTLSDFTGYEPTDNAIDDTVIYVINNLHLLSEDMLSSLEFAYKNTLQEWQIDGGLSDEGEALGYYSYMQTDPLWADVSYPAGGVRRATIGTSGCGPTAMATILASYLHEEVSVVDLCNYALENGYRVYGGTTNQFFYDVAADFEAEGLPDPVQCYGDSVDALYDAVKNNGHMAIALMGRGLFTSTGHFVTIVDAKEIDGKQYFLVSDPNYPNKNHGTSNNMIDENPEDPLVWTETSVFKTQTKTIFWFQHNFDEIPGEYNTTNDEELPLYLTDAQELNIDSKIDIMHNDMFCY